MNDDEKKKKNKEKKKLNEEEDETKEETYTVAKTITSKTMQNTYLISDLGAHHEFMVV